MKFVGMILILRLFKKQFCKHGKHALVIFISSQNFKITLDSSLISLFNSSISALMLAMASKYEIDPEQLQIFFYVILGMMKVFFFHFSKVSVDILFRVTFGTSLPRMLA